MRHALIPFKQDILVSVNDKGVHYVALRPIVEAIGLRWSSQRYKIRSSNNLNCIDIDTVATDGKKRKMLCIPLKKLNGWLFSVNPNKVKPEIREKLISYQEECFQVLYDYWHSGYAINPRFTRAEHQYLRELLGDLHYRVFFPR